MARVACLGAALQDIYLIDRDDFATDWVANRSVFGRIEIGTKVDIDQIDYQVGGGGTNAATTFARQGHEAVFMGSVAQDAAGESVLALLDEEEIDSSYVCLSENGHTGCSVVLLDIKSGERTILTHRGVSVDFVDFDENDLEKIRPDWLYVTTLGGDLGTLMRFLEKAHEIGCQIMLNPGMLEIENDNFRDVLEYVDVLLVNKVEATHIVGGDTLKELIFELGKYVKKVIITNGSMGGIAKNEERVYRFGVYEDVRVKDTTGAGDAFGSGFLARYIGTGDFQESLCFASANSTAVVRKLGAKTGILKGAVKLHPMPIQEVKL